MGIFLQDMKFALRMFAKSKPFTAVAVITLALGIGANTAIFSVINSVLLRPLPFTDPERLVQLWETEPSPGNYPMTGPDYLDWQAQNQTFEAMTLFSWNRIMNASGKEQPESVFVVAAQANFFAVLGAQPIHGRAFSPGEDRPGKNRIAVLSYAFWQRKFGGDPAVVGKTFDLDSESYYVVGVMPRWLKYPRDTDLWIPFDMSPKSLGFRGTHNYRALGRLKDGITVSQAQADLSLIAKRLEQQYPDSNEKIGAVVVPLKEQVIRSSREQLLILLGAVAFVLLIACANIANLLLSRAAGRQHEIALRAAMGASRWRLLRQLLTESVLLSLAGAALGLLAASWGVSALQAAQNLPIPRQNDIRIDLTVLLFTAAVSIAVGILFGLAPALHASGLNLSEELKKSAQAASGASGTRKVLRDALVVSEIALSLALLVGAGLLLRSFFQMRNVDIGIQSKKILTLQLNLPEKKYSTLAARREFFDRLLERLQHAPGIESAAVGTQIPLEGGSNGYILVPGQDDAGFKNQLFEWNYVTSDHFRTWGIPFLKGRNFNADDINRVAEVNLKVNEIFAAPNPPKQLPKDLSWVAVINNTMARMIWHDEDPVGKTFMTGDILPVRVIGVVADVKARGIRGQIAPQAYYPLTGALDNADRLWHVAAKTGVSPLSVLGTIRKELSTLDDSLALLKPRTIDDVISDAMLDTTLQASLLSAFAALALLLAAIGLYSVMAYLVTQRTHEIGIRMALGARRSDVLKLVLGHGSRLTLLGLALGVASALALNQLMRGLLFGVGANDMLTFTAVVVLLLVVALVACAIPAWRAAHVEPLVALRWE
jgi:putative ABC transport system permease protein